MNHRLIQRYIIAACFVVMVVIFFALARTAIVRGNQRHQIAMRNQAAIVRQLTMLQGEVRSFQSQNASLNSAAAAAQTQANTSVGQLTAAGKTPIISAPGVVTVSTTPSTTTTLPPVVVTVPVPVTTTTTTEPPETTTTTTQPPDTTTTTTAPPDTTTTTEPPDTTTTSPADTSTTTGE